ncbi:MAG TPA: glutamate-5-semialdehyde dehydrogenase [Egibacteraceae bacterium]|nr:glutamate-5-semialdehyde dehydrogenase [Egibacteraceae bacterium]
MTLTVRDVCAAAKAAAPALARASTDRKNSALERMAAGLDAAHDEVLAANAGDVERGREQGLSEALIDRLILTGPRLDAIAGALRELIALTDPVGQIVRGFTLPNGLQVRQVRVPMGVIAMVYEGRPNVTVDAAGLALKSGNACVLRGSSSALESNLALSGVLRAALEDEGLPADAVCLVPDTTRESVAELCRARGLVDLLIPRGGAGLISSVVRDAQVPVIETGVGNCHVYVDAAADLAMATAITVNAKAQRPSVCNAAETLLVHAAIAEEFLPAAAKALTDAGVELIGDAEAQRLAGAGPATDEDWDTEFLDYRLAVRVVDSLDAAIEHIARHGTLHTEAIITDDRAAARRFTAEVDAAAVMVNASTRFTDGGEFGFGAEIGISTQKMHARGPMGLQELTTTKYIVEGDGQVRS